MIVTTSYNPAPSLIRKAEQFAGDLGARAVSRRNLTVPKLQRRYRVRDVLVVTEQGLRCYRDDQPPLFFHPSMTYLRIMRLLEGQQEEPLLQLADIRPGDTVIDCTAGLCSDAILFSYAVGENGKVMAVEADPLISLIAREGLMSYETDLPAVNEAMRRISVIRGHHLDILRQQADRSADVIYFDPMFAAPLEESASILPLRSFAYDQPLSQEAIREAKRVARRTIVLKERRGSSLFAELGFDIDQRVNAKIAYGVIRIS